MGLRREEIIKVEVDLNESASLYPQVDVVLAPLDDDGDLVRRLLQSVQAHTDTDRFTAALRLLLPPV